MSAPGAGKTTLLEATLPGLDAASESSRATCRGRWTPTGSRISTSRSCSSTPTPASAASAISTRTWCARRSPSSLDEIDLLVIENVGNLVCPAEFRVGEDARAMICSVTEGEDKPLKYPLMFRACELVVVNKIDLLPHLDFDVDRLRTTSSRSSRRRALIGAAPGPARASSASASGCRRWRRGGRRGLTRRSGTGRLDWPCSPSEPRPTSLLRGAADRVAHCCHRMAERFARGGRLISLGFSPGGAFGRAPRRRGVRASGDRRQASPAGDRPLARGWPLDRAGRADRRAGRHRDRLRHRRAGRARRSRRSRWPGSAAA